MTVSGPLSASALLLDIITVFIALGFNVYLLVVLSSSLHYTLQKHAHTQNQTDGGDMMGAPAFSPPVDDDEGEEADGEKA